MLEPQLRQVQELQEQAKASRKKGDAFRKVRRQSEALAAYETGLEALNDALDVLRSTKERILAADPPLPPEFNDGLHELVETLGARGGLLQRLQRLKEAAVSYSEGADLERRFSLASTYNRLNSVKSRLLSGESRLRDLEPNLLALVEHIETSLRQDKSLSDSGWAWADLGDCLALLGKADEARKAYASFISKAEIKSPERALDVLREIAAKLKESADQDAPRVQAAIDILASGLGQ